MTISLHKSLLLPVLLVCASGVAWAIPGFHIRDDASVKEAVQSYADHPDQFRAVVYQAILDKNTWRLSLDAHDYLQQKPGDPARECSFAQAYWQSQQVGTNEVVPQTDSQRLRGLYGEAVMDTKKAAVRLPHSVAAHVTYGQYLQWFGLMDKSNIPLMLREYRAAVALSPADGELRFKLAQGLAGSGDRSFSCSAETVMEYKKALLLAPSLTESYFGISAAYWREQDWQGVKIYLDKYVAANPAVATRPDIVAARKTVAEKLGGG